MRRETEAWENDQILDPEKKLAEVESAPPSEPEQANGALDPTSSRKAGELPEGAPETSPKEEVEAKPEPSTAPDQQEASASTEQDPSAKTPQS